MPSPSSTAAPATAAAEPAGSSASRRDRAILAAVDAGRCVVAGTALLVDGRCCADQFAGARLRTAGWIEVVARLSAVPGVAVAGVGVAELTMEGRAQITAR